MTVSPEPSLIEWVDQHTGLGLPFKGRTDAVEKGLLLLKQTMEAQSRDARLLQR